MADENRNKGIDELTGRPPEDGKSSPKNDGSTPPAAPLTEPPVSDKRPGVDVGGVPRSPATSAPQHTPIVSKGAPPSSSPDAPTRSSESGGSLAPADSANSHPPVDTGGVGAPLQAQDEAPGNTAGGESNLPSNQDSGDNSPQTAENVNSGTANRSGGGTSGNAQSKDSEQASNDSQGTSESTMAEEQSSETEQDRGKAAAQQLEQRFQGAGAEALEGAAEKQAARAGLAAVAPYAVPLGIGCLVLFFFFLFVGLAVAGIAGSGKKGGDTSRSSAPAGEITESGKELREAFLAQKNITYQKEIIKTEIRDGGVDEKVIKAVLAAARSKGAGTIAISAAGCRSHSASGGHHCPKTPSTALDIGSAGTSNANGINAFLCKSVKDGNPYKIDELFGIISPSGCVVNGGKPGGGNPDPPNHIHVATG